MLVREFEDPKQVEVDLYGNAERGYVLSKIVVPKELRGTGIGTSRRRYNCADT